MDNVRRITKGPHKTPRPGKDVMQMETIKLGVRTRVALVGLAGITALTGLGVGVNIALDHFATTPVPKEAPDITKPESYDPNANEHGTPTSGAEDVDGL